jgi:predicted outer membrane repeat protein
MKSKIACLCLALAAGVSAYGATTVTVGPKLDPETGNTLTDPETGMPLGDVDALTNWLKTAGNNTTISLGKGLYDLSPLTNAPMYKADGSGYGAALLHMPYGTLNLEVVGATGNPEDVVLFANDSNFRILMMDKNPNYRSELRNVTIAGGNALGMHINTEAYRRGGGVFVNGSDKTVVSNCVFRGNRADKQGGAIGGKGDTPLAKVIDCKIISNTSSGDGGGIYNIALVENCTVVSNTASGNGGGLANCGFVANTVLSYNCAQKGGGASNCALSDCTNISHNVATSASDGGGLYSGSATNCVFRDNYASAAVGCSYLLKCDISDIRTDAAVVDSCTFHDISNIRTGIAVGNVSYPDGRDAPVLTNSGEYDRVVTLRDATIIRNSLFTNCLVAKVSGNINKAVFQSEPSSGAATIENCTIADNQYVYLFRAGNGSTFSPSFVNCAIVGNTHDGTTARDVSSRQGAQYMTLTNCAYGVMADRVTQAEGVEDSGCIQKTRAECKFVGEGDNPYSLQLKSPLREQGVVLDWMAEGTDLAGNPRLRDGKVDIGAYECWEVELLRGLKIYFQ